MIKPNKTYHLKSTPGFLFRIWMNAWFAIIVFTTLFFLCGGIRFSPPSIIILIALVVAVYYQRKKAIVYICEMKSDETNLSIHYYFKNELRTLEIPLNTGILQKSHEKAKHKGYYKLDIYVEKELKLTQHQFTMWNEEDINNVINTFGGTDFK